MGRSISQSPTTRKPHQSLYFKIIATLTDRSGHASDGGTPPPYCQSILDDKFSCRVQAYSRHPGYQRVHAELCQGTFPHP